MKICTKCKIEKDENQFNFRNKLIGKLQSNCRDCQKIMKDNHYNSNKDWYMKRNLERRNSYREWFSKFKSTLKCSYCGENHPSTLDFHHEDPNEKEYEISVMVHNSHHIDKILEEITKCIVLCANCHRKIHWEISNKE